MNGSAFPTTHATWLRTLVGDGVATAARGNAAETARIAVMERYAEPLSVFVRGSSLARLGEPNEIVNGFFAARLSDAAFLEGWARSGMRLRRWLMNGMLFYGQGLARDRARAAARGGAVEFEIFRRHAIHGQPYAVFAREVGKSEQQCAGATRLVAQRVRTALAEVLREEGVAEHELDDEIARVRGAL